MARSTTPVGHASSALRAGARPAPTAEGRTRHAGSPEEAWTSFVPSSASEVGDAELHSAPCSRATRVLVGTRHAVDDVLDRRGHRAPVAPSMWWYNRRLHAARLQLCGHQFARPLHRTSNVERMPAPNQPPSRHFERVCLGLGVAHRAAALEAMPAPGAGSAGICPDRPASSSWAGALAALRCVREATAAAPASSSHRGWPGSATASSCSLGVLTVRLRASVGAPGTAATSRCRSPDDARDLLVGHVLQLPQDQALPQLVRK